MTLGFSWPGATQQQNVIFEFSWPDTIQQKAEEKRDRVPRIKLIRSATHYKFGVNLRFSWPKIHSIKEHDTWVFLARYRTTEHMTPRFSWPGVSDSTRDMILGFSWPDHSSRDFRPRVFLARFVTTVSGCQVFLA